MTGPLILHAPLPMPVTLAGCFVLGAVIASCLALIADRWPRGEPFVCGRSRCRACGRELRARDLVPVVSWLALRGRCAQCGTAIPPALVLAELAGGASASGIAMTAVSGVAALAMAGFAGALIVLALIDAAHLWLPDRITLPLVLAGLASAAAIPDPAIDARAWGAAVGWGGLAAVGAVYRRIRGHDGLGAGDGKLLGAIGAWCGVGMLAPVMLLAALLGLSAAAIARLRGHGIAADTPLPFGTMLAVAALMLSIGVPAIWALMRV